MKFFKAFPLLILITLVFEPYHSTAQSGTAGIYVGGHFRRERPGTITQLKASGFSYVILFNISVEANGDLTTDGETICKNGAYVFGNTQPYYVSDVTSLKQGVTSIKRVESCIGGWGNHSYANIKALVASQGTGTGSILYRNFQALKNAIPSMDAINNDDEETYDVNSATAFHVMLANLGYKTTLAPYMNKSYWQQLATNVNNQKPGSVDRIDLQWYEGGAGNNPCNWNINNIPLYTGDLNYAEATSVSNKMTSAKNNCGAKGGFIWVYNDNGVNLRQLAGRINDIYGGPAVTRGAVATFYGDCSYGGSAIGLPEGTFTKAQLLAYGIPANSISSIKVNPGYSVKVFVNDNFSGTNATFTDADECLVDNNLNDNISSIQITAKGISGFSGNFYIRNRSSKLYMDVSGAAVTDGSNLIQWTGSFGDNQQFSLVELGNGIYRINGVKSGKSFDITDQNPLNATQLQIWTYYGSYNQQFILVQNNAGYYQLIARHSGLALKVEGSSNSTGAKIKQATNDGSTYSQWLLTPVNSTGAVSFYSDCNYGGYKVSLGEGTYTTKDLISKGISDNDISSLKVNQGYVVRVYVDNNQSGTNALFSASDDCLTDNGLNDNISSLVIRANGVTGLNKQFFIQNRNSGQYMNLSGGSNANGGVIVQWPFENGDNEKFTFTDQGNGVYKIISAKSGKAFDIEGGNTAQGTVLQQWDYTGAAQQKFIVISTGDGFYKLIPTHANQIIEVKDASKASGSRVQQWSDNGQTCGQWKFIPTNDIPVVTISAPSNNTVVNAPATINLAATATDAFANITKVEFYNGTTKLGEDATAPYTYSWANVAAGTYSITAKAINEISGTATSSVISIKVNSLPTVSVTAPANNATYVAAATVNLTATATDADGSISKVDFYNGTTLLYSDASAPYSYSWTNVAAGTYTITAKATDNNNGVTTSPPVTVKVNANNNPVVSLTSPTASTAFTAPATVAIAANATDSDGTVTKVEFFQGTTKLGEKTSPPYTHSWADVAAGTYSITAKATDDKGGTTTSAAVSITVKAPNVAPAVTLTSPTANTAFTAPTTVAITANATDSDGSITKVEFFQGTTKLDEKTSPPYTYNWTNVAAGTYSITAKATDNSGAVTTSAAVSITVKAPNAAPTITLTSPTAGAIFAAPATIAISANAADSDGSIVKVEFYNGSTKIGESTMSPFEFTWTDVVLGTYTITAKAYDNEGLATSSAPVSITVTKTTGIDDNNLLSNGLNIFPNPADQELYITSEADLTGSTVEVADIYGNGVFSTKADGFATVLNTEALAPGVYFLRIRQNEAVSIHRFIKR